MLVCDKWGKLLSNKTRNWKVTLRTQEAEIGGHEDYEADMCDECRMKYLIFKSKMDLYFMNHEEPLKIFDDKK